MGCQEGAIAIAGASQKEFDAAMQCGLFTPAQVRDAEALRATLLAKRKPTLGQRLAEAKGYVPISKHAQQEKEDIPMPTLGQDRTRPAHAEAHQRRDRRDREARRLLARARRGDRQLLTRDARDARPRASRG
jgi:hypothetical protein